MTSSFSIPVPAGTTGFATVIFYALSPSGDTCTFSRTIYLTCPGDQPTGCCFDTTNTFITSLGMSTPNGDCLFGVSAYYSLIDRECQFLGYQWTTSWLSTGIVPTSSMTIPVPAGGTGFATVTFYALKPNGDTCKFTRTITFRCPDDVPTGCCFDTLHTTLTDFGTSLISGGCLFTCNATVAMLDPRCDFLGYQWSTSWLSTGISSMSSVGVVVASGATGFATVTFYALNAQGDTCKFSRTVILNCPGDGSGTGTIGHKSGSSGDGPGEGPGGISIYPNPTNDAVVVSSTKDEISTIQVIDVNGQKVGNYTYDHTKSATVSLSSLPPGTYMLRVNNTTSKTVTKIE